MPTAKDLLGAHFCEVHAIDEMATQKISFMRPMDLFSERRLDIIPKLLLATAHETLIEVREMEYLESISAITRGQFRESGQPLKSDSKAYLGAFSETYRQIEQYGFDPNRSVIPVTIRDGRPVILDGAHRVAIARALGLEKIPVVEIEQPGWVPDISARWFLSAGVEPNLVESWVSTLVEESAHAAIVLWPSASHLAEAVEADLKLFGLNCTYRAHRYVNRQTLRHVVTETYAPSSPFWLGAPENGFRGARGKVRAVVAEGPHLKSIAVLFVSSQDHEDVFHKTLSYKQHLRAGMSRQGNNEVHATDTSQETQRIANAVLGESNRVFLANGRPYRFARFVRRAYQVRKSIDAHGLNYRDVVLVGSSPLGAYGIRPPADFDFLVRKLDDADILSQMPFCESHHHVASDYASTSEGSPSVEQLLSLESFNFAGLRFADLRVVLGAANRRRERTRRLDAQAILRAAAGSTITLRIEAYWLYLRVRRLPLLAGRKVTLLVWAHKDRVMKMLAPYPRILQWAQSTVITLVDKLNRRGSSAR